MDWSIANIFGDALNNIAKAINNLAQAQNNIASAIREKKKDDKSEQG